jgi:hypothetical protein
MIANFSKRPLGRLVAFASFLAISAVAPACWAQAPSATYYVATTGNDTTNSGTSTASPFATINKALSLSTGGQTIAVASGSYNAVKDNKVRTLGVTLLGYGATPPVITTTGSSNGFALTFAGSQGLTFDNFKMTGVVEVGSTTNSDITAVVQRTKDIVVRNCEITGGQIYLYKGAQNITFDNNWIHGSGYGFFDKGYGLACDGITITNNLIEDMTTDGIQFGYWTNVLIDSNVIRRLYIVSGSLHNDCIQLSGRGQHIAITNNVLCHSGDQNLLIKADSGPIDDVLVQNNLIYDSGEVSVQVSGTNNARFINNTIWNRPYGNDGMYLWGSSTNAIIANNCFSTFRKLEGAVPAYEDYNFSTQTGLYGSHDIRNSNTSFESAAFVNSPSGDFHPTPTSQLLGKGTPLYAPALDLDGNTRSTTAPAIGAYEAGFSPSRTNLALWLKADSGVTANSSGAVSEWQDQSGAGHHATQSSSSLQPGLATAVINGKPAVFFAGSDSMGIGSIASSQYQVVAVAQPATNITTRATILGGATGCFHYRIDSNYNQGVAKATIAVLGVSNTSVPTTSFSRLDTTYGNPDLNFRLGGAPDGGTSSAATFDAPVTTLGARAGADFFKGYIAEILVFTSPQSRAQTARIEDYLASKYGV